MTFEPQRFQTEDEVTYEAADAEGIADLDADRAICDDTTKFGVL
jgi:hypothetical protein